MRNRPPKRTNFQRLYRDTYSALGFPLKARDGILEKTLSAAEKKCGHVLPKSLRDYYLVAGKEKKLNTAFQQLVPPRDWEIHDGKIVFMAENQCVVVWGTNVRDPHAKDPKVFQSPLADGELKTWYDQGVTCSQFLVFMLHMQSAYGGGMPRCAAANATEETRSLLDKNWTFGGEVMGMRTYHKPGQAICLLKQKDFFTKTPTWRISAGARTAKLLDAMAEELKVDWENNGFF